jgi:hypothetical protein
MNSIKELEKPRGDAPPPKDDTPEEEPIEVQPNHSFKPTMSFESIYPDEDDDVTFSHTPSHPERPEEQKEKSYRHTFYGKNSEKLYSRSSRFQAL